MTKVFFKARCYTEMGQRVVLAGSDPTLGSWDPRKSKVELVTDAASYPYWTGALSAPVGTDALFKIVVVGRDGRTRWEDKVENRALRFPAMDAQLTMAFDDGKMETTLATPAEQEILEAPPEAPLWPRREQSPPRRRASPAPEAAPAPAPEPDSPLERLVQEALTRAAEAGRRAEIAESRSLRCEKRAEEAEYRAVVAEKMVAELQAKLAFTELQGARAELAQKVHAELDLGMRGEGHMQKVARKARAARSRKYAGYSPNSSERDFSRRTTSNGSLASSCDPSDCGWASGLPSPSRE